MTSHDHAVMIERVLRGVQRPNLRRDELSGDIMAAIDSIAADICSALAFDATTPTVPFGCDGVACNTAAMVKADKEKP